MNIVSLKFTAGPAEAAGGIRMTNEEVFSDLTLTDKVRRVNRDAAWILSIAPGVAVGPARLIFNSREVENGNSWPGGRICAGGQTPGL